MNYFYLLTVKIYVAFEQPIDPIYEGAWEIVKDTNAATSGAREVGQGRFRRKLYPRVAGMSLGGRREAESAHTTTARKKGSEALPDQRCLGENGKAG